MYQFRNDYSLACHPRILEALSKHISEQNPGYGEDNHSIHAKNLIKETFSLPETSDIYFLSGGTQTNLTVISFLLKPYEAVISCDTGHINVHETGAIEATGHKVLTALNEDGKIKPQEIEKIVLAHNSCHMVKPKMVYISNSTETGSIYSTKELLDIREICDKYDLYLYLDGARLGVAQTSVLNDVDLSLYGKICDCFYIGGTKNGLLFGEAVVFPNSNLSKDFNYHIKNRGALNAKGFVLGVQFEELFKDNLYFDLSRASNEKAQYILNKLPKLAQYSPSNQLFLTLPPTLASNLIDNFGCELWSQESDKITIRIVTSFSTTFEDCDEIINYINSQK